MKCPECEKKCVKSTCWNDGTGWAYWYCGNEDCGELSTKIQGKVKK